MQRLRKTQDTIPIERRMGLEQFIDVRDPGKPLPEILRTVNAKHRQQVFRGEGGNFAIAQEDGRKIADEGIEVWFGGKMAQGDFGVQFHHRAARLVAVIVLAGNQRCGGSGR